jgi:predicted nucleotidyltransferase
MGAPVEVEVVDLCRFIKELEEPVGLLKLDVEGEEIDILNALIDQGLHSRIRHILAEVHEHIPSVKEPSKKLKERIREQGITNIDLTWA